MWVAALVTFDWDAQGAQSNNRACGGAPVGAGASRLATRRIGRTEAGRSRCMTISHRSSWEHLVLVLESGTVVWRAVEHEKSMH
eukprot:5673457-Prymnesium_polylepis.1